MNKVEINVAFLVISDRASTNQTEDQATAAVEMWIKSFNAGNPGHKEWKIEFDVVDRRMLTVVVGARRQSFDVVDKTSVGQPPATVLLYLPRRRGPRIPMYGRVGSVPVKTT